MSELKTEFQYVLQTPFEYASAGNVVEASFVSLKAPASRNSRECAQLKQAFWRSVEANELEAKNPEDFGEKESQVDGQAIMMVMAMSKHVDLGDVIEAAKHLFTKGKVALIDGEVPMTKPTLDEMSHEDVDAMVGDYMVNFILASSLSRMKKQSSKASST